MVQTLEEIALLAEFIAEENTTRDKTNLEKIARSNNIAIHYGLFENYFTGMLQHENGLFNIFINLSKLKNKKHTRTRFTIAHELGHYYIDAHRNLLKRGYSLSYDKELSYFSNDPVEKEANHFATNLLMPPSKFIADMKANETGFKSVKKLASKYDTSLTSTLIQYRNFLNNPCFIVFWDTNQDFRRKNFSDSFFNLIKQFSRDFLLTNEIKTEIFEGFNHPFFKREITSIEGKLSSFFSSISCDSSMDISVKIETMSLQSYGYASLVIVTESN